MEENKTPIVNTIKDATEFILSKFKKEVHLGAPLGLGKPNDLLNSLFQVALDKPYFSLNLYSALSLSLPQAKSDLEKKFLNPFLKTHFGENYPDLLYTQYQKQNKLPKNIRIHEFYVQSGAYLKSESAQQDYISLNYTHVAQALYNKNLDGIVQLIAKKIINGKTHYSLSCNPDLTLDLVDLYKKNKKKFTMIGVVHPDLPFMGADAQVDADFFELIVDSSEVTHKLFALPRKPISAPDYLIGLHASRLIQDDGTLQIGIGSLSDALVHATILRHHKNSIYKELIQDFLYPDLDITCFDNRFEKGLYGTSEMIMDGFMHLRKNGILKRTVLDSSEEYKRFLHGAFFLGSKDFYDWLRNLSGEDFSGICMTKVSKVNDLYDENEMAIRRQRKNARFFNTCMQVSLLGSAASETLENGKIVSGVGGQYNFVAMSSELPDSHSVLMLRSTRGSGHKRTSNITWSHGYSTIPRHLRDIVITEYGIASLRGKSDEEVIKALIAVTDSQFQDELVFTAKKNSKLNSSYKIPIEAKNNTPEKISSFIKNNKNHFPPYPFGNDFSKEEETLALALSQLKKSTKLELLAGVSKGFFVSKEHYKAELARMNLLKVKGAKDLLYQKLLLSVLKG